MDLKKLSILAPIIGAYFIFLGYLDQYLYYQYWEINITSYLELSEVTIYFLHTCVQFGWFVLIFSTQFLVLQMFARIQKRFVKTKATDHSSHPENHYANEKQIINWVGFVFSLILFLVAASFFYKGASTWSLYFTSFYAVQSALLGADLLSLEWQKTQKMYLMFFTFLFGISYTFLLVHRRAMEVRESKQKVVLIDSNDKEINYDESFIYLGKTANFYFLYNNVMEQSVILNKDQVKIMVIGNHEND